MQKLLNSNEKEKENIFTLRSGLATYVTSEHNIIMYSSAACQ